MSPSCEYEGLHNYLDDFALLNNQVASPSKRGQQGGALSAATRVYSMGG
jgi:hypothetical protein